MAAAPERTCVACRKKGAKHEFMRVVATPTGAAADKRQRAPGRGAYICDNDDCRAAALSKGTLARALRRSRIETIENLGD